MIANLALSLLVLTSVAALAPAASAESVGAGDCSKAGLCAGACVAATSGCQGGSLACAGFSYQVPQCVGSSAQVSAEAARCVGLPCDVINLVCQVVLRQPCVG